MNNGQIHKYLNIEQFVEKLPKNWAKIFREFYLKQPLKISAATVMVHSKNRAPALRCSAILLNHDAALASSLATGSSPRPVSSIIPRLYCARACPCLTALQNHQTAISSSLITQLRPCSYCSYRTPILYWPAGSPFSAALL